MGAVVTCPLEVIKVRLQSSAGLSCNGNGSNPGPSTSKVLEDVRGTSLRRIMPSLSVDTAYRSNTAYLHEEAGKKIINGGFGDAKKEFLTRKASAYKNLFDLHSRSLTGSAEAQTSTRLGLQVFRHLR